MLYAVLALYITVWNVLGSLPPIYGSDPVEGSVPTSIDGMISLLNVESDLLQNFEAYINDLEQRAARMRRTLDIMRAENTKAKTNGNEYVGNPINSFSLIRRLHEDWIKWELFMSEPIGQERIEFIQKTRSKLPNRSDLLEAALAMYRLQVTYDLVPLDLTKGLLNKVQYDTKLSPQDAFRIGSELFNDNAFAAGYWIYAALEAYDDKTYIDPIHEFNKLTILELYSKTLQRQNRWNDALIVIDIGLGEAPNNAKFLNYRLEIENHIKTNYVHKEEAKEIYTPDNNYKIGCQGRYEKKPSQLYCVYNSTTNAFLKLAPLKMEIILMDPYMVIYHDVISDNEIEQMKKLALPDLKRATVYNHATQKSNPTKTRTSQVSWLSDNLNDLTKTLNRRISDMTGFNMQGAEMLQAMNYGVGGHYDTHYDFFNNLPANDTRGDRIATVLFYLSDVQQGGGTVFPTIKKLVLPQKGTAIIWHNLDNRGNGNTKALHAACPVIVGSKWVCNKWVRSVAQMFNKPCFKE